MIKILLEPEFQKEQRLTMKNLIMKLSVPLVIISFLLSAPKAQAIEDTAYAFPVPNPLLATLTAAVYGTSVKYKKIEIEIRSDRRHVKLMEGRHKIKIGLFKQPRNAPLVFVIAGLGGSGFSGASLLLAEDLYHRGYHVVTLPNAFSWNYVLGVSESATPGYMPRDSAEYYEFMKKVNSYLLKSEGLKISSYYLMGHSLGGLLSVFITQADDTQQAFQFQKVVLINPAMNVNHGFNVLDSFYRDGSKLSYQRKAVAFSTVVDLGLELKDAPFSGKTLKVVAPKLAKLSKLDYEWLIGNSFRQSLRDIIYASQQVRDTGLLKTKASEFKQNARLEEAEKFSFEDYIKKVLPPTINDENFVELVYKSGFYNLKDYIKENSKIYVFENEDDMIISSEDILFLKENLENRLTLYPHGGHMGNLWWPQNKRDLSQILSTVH